jgi:hypothetical protein
MIGWFESQYDAMLELLRRLVDTDSGSYDRHGVARGGRFPPSAIVSRQD